MESNTVTPNANTCDICNKHFSSNSVLKKHQVVHSDVRPFVCEFCEKSFKRVDTLRDHKTSHFDLKPYSCSECSKSFRRVFNLRQHKKRKHFSIQKDELKVKTKKVSKQKKSDIKVLKSVSQEETIHEEKSVCENQKSELSLYETYKVKTQHHKRYDTFNVTSITFEAHAENLSLFFKNLKFGFYNELFFQLLEKNSYQWYIVVTATLVRSNPDGYSDYIIPHLRSEMITQYTEDNLLETIENIFQKITKKFDEFNAWTFLNVNFLELNMSKI